MDIWDHKLYRLDLTKGPDSLKVVETDASVGWVLQFPGNPLNCILLKKTTWTFSVTANIAESNQLIVGAKFGFARLDQTTGKLSYIHDTRKLWGEDGGKAER